MTPREARADYAPTHPRRTTGGVISTVEPGSAAALAGLVPGDVIVSADGHHLSDVIDWHWYADGPSVEVEYRRGDDQATVSLEREWGASWGIGFEDALFNGVRRCANDCTFCFMGMLPEDLRDPLYIKDDDFRLSFLQGNFVTLTNLRSGDIERIVEQRLEPLHVSVHAWDDTVREGMIGRAAARGKENLIALLDRGIELHAQIVLVPGVNDGPVLDETLNALLAYDAVLSIGIVPLGFTRFQDRFSESFDTPDSAGAVVDQVEAIARREFARHGAYRVHLGDEFHLYAGREVPPAERYEGFEQYEDGIGMVRSFLDESANRSDEITALVAALPPDSRDRIRFLTGEIFAPVLRETLVRYGLPPASVVGIPNRFFGGNVDVTGLLTGQDLLEAITALPAGAAVFVPDIVLNSDGVLLDDSTPADLRSVGSTAVSVVSCDVDGVIVALSSLTAQ